MGGLSIWHWLIVLLVVVVLFGSGKVSSLMGDVATGIKAFKKNMQEDDAAPAEAALDRPAGSIASSAAPLSLATARDRETIHKA